MKKRLSPSFPDPIGQVDDDGTRMKCEVCGARRRSVGGHLRQHNMTAAQYREMFGLTQGLVAEASRERYADANRRLGKVSLMKEAHPALPSNKGRKHGPLKPQTLLRISEAQKRRFVANPPKKGVPRSAEDRAAISEGVRRWNAARGLGSST